ncbi:unnamed protein product [Leuciscus chuanchicus]
MSASSRGGETAERLKAEIGRGPSQTPLFDPFAIPKMRVDGVPRQQRDPRLGERAPNRPPRRMAGGSGASSRTAPRNAHSQPPRELTVGMLHSQTSNTKLKCVSSPPNGTVTYHPSFYFCISCHPRLQEEKKPTRSVFLRLLTTWWYFKNSVQQERSEPEPSCVSLRSDWSMGLPIHFKNDDTQTDLRSIPPQRSAVTKPACKKNDQSMNQLQDFNESRDAGVSHEVLNTFRSNLMKKFKCLNEGTAKQGNPTLLNEIYTELYITEGDSGEICNEHEAEADAGSEDGVLFLLRLPVSREA